MREQLIIYCKKKNKTLPQLDLHLSFCFSKKLGGRENLLRRGKVVQNEKSKISKKNRSKKVAFFFQNVYSFVLETFFLVWKTRFQREVGGGITDFVWQIVSLQKLTFWLSSFLPEVGSREVGRPQKRWDMNCVLFQVFLLEPF